MNRRDFPKHLAVTGGGLAIMNGASAQPETSPDGAFYTEPAKKLPIREFDVVVAGGGTGGVFAAVSAARTGARVALVEGKGYTGGTAVEGGTALHSFFNLWKPYPDVKKRQVVRGLPSEFIDRLIAIGGCSGHAEMVKRYDYDSVCTAIDTELYKLESLKLLKESGVHLFLNSFVRGAVKDGERVKGAIVESRSGRELFKAKAFIDCTGYGDLAAYAGAKFSEPNDYPVVNSYGLANVDVERVFQYLEKNDAVKGYGYGTRSGEEDKLIRINGIKPNLPEAFTRELKGVSFVTTTVQDNYFMFIKTNLKLRKSPTDRDAVTKAEIQIRENMQRSADAFKKYIPGMEKSFIARTSPSLVIRRGRTIECDYDLTNQEITSATHFDDEVFNYGFHDHSPRFKIGKGETYGLPYRALCVSGVSNLFACGMIITSDRDAHMSTRNTVSCMAQGQAVGTAAALCVKQNAGTRDLKFSVLKDRLMKDKVYFEG